MLRSFGKRVTGNFSGKNFGSSSGRRFISNKPTSNTQLNVRSTERKPADGAGTTVVALIAVALIAAAPVIYIKNEKIQLDAQIENVIGTLLGTSAVLFLRPDAEIDAGVIESPPSLYKPEQNLEGFGESADTYQEQSDTVFTSDSEEQASEPIVEQEASAGASLSTQNSSVAAEVEAEVEKKSEEVAVEVVEEKELVCPFPPKKAVVAEAAPELVCPLPAAAAKAVPISAKAGKIQSSR